MNAKLLNEAPVLILPSLAVDLGLNEAIVVQQLHWNLGRDSAEVHDSRRWIRMGYADWQKQFPWWSERTLKRVFSDLLSMGLIERRRSGAANLWSVDYPRLDIKTGQDVTPQSAITVDPEGQTGTPPCKREGEEKEEEGTAPVDTLFAAEPSLVQQEEDKVQIVWDFYFNVFGDRLAKKELTPSRVGAIRKGLKATADDTELLKVAILGLKSYRDSHPDGSKDVTLDAIFKTRPGGSNLTDQIEWWAAQAPLGSDGPTVVIPNHMKHTASQHQITVARFMNRTREIPDSLEEESKVSAAWLRDELGIEAKRREDGTIQWVKISEHDA